MRSALKFSKVDSKKTSWSCLFDQYVKCDLSFDNNNELGTLLYWRLIDPSFSLIEIGISSATSRVMSATVVLYNGQLESCPQSCFDNVNNIESGIPVFDLTRNDWVNGFCDVSGRCRLQKRDISLRIQLFATRPDRIAIYERFSFEVDANQNLVAITIGDLEVEEWKLLNLE